MHVPNVIQRDVIVCAVSVLVVLVAIINYLQSYLGFFKSVTDRHTDGSGYRVALQLKIVHLQPTLHF